MNVNILRSTATIVLVILWKEFQLSESRIVQQCPLTNDTWMKRSDEIGCENKGTGFYHCYRNSEGELEEKCTRLLVADPSGGCPYFNARYEIGYTNCTGTGCPKDSDPLYLMNKIYKYPSCLKQRIVVTESVVPSVEINTSEETAQVIHQKSSTPLVIDESSMNNSQVMFSVPSALILFTGSFIILLLLIVKFQITEKVNNSHAQLRRDIESVNETLRSLAIQLQHYETKRGQDGRTGLYESMQRYFRNEDPYDELRKQTENNVEAVYKNEGLP